MIKYVELVIGSFINSGARVLDREDCECGVVVFDDVSAKELPIVEEAAKNASDFFGIIMLFLGEL